MLKGISQSKRNNAWHTRNTKKKAKAKAYRQVMLAYYRSGGRVKDRAERQYKEALEREKLVKVGFWKRILYFFKRLFIFNKKQYA